LFEDGSAPNIIPQPEVAALLRNISEHGVEYFYKGDWAKKAVAVLRSWGSNITMDHFATYYDHNHPEWQDPQVDELTNGRTMHSIGIKNSIAWPHSNSHRVVEAYNIMHELGLLNGDSDFTNNGTVLSYYLLVNRYGNYMEWLARHGLKYPSFIYASFTGPLAPVEEEVWLFDPISAAKYRTSKQHAKRIAEAIQSREGLDKLNKVIDFFTVFVSAVTGLRDFSSGQHSDGIVVHDKHGNSISMIHTINDRYFGSGLFVQGVALPSSLWIHSDFLQGPWNDRSKSVSLPIGHSVNLVTSKDGLPETLVTAVADAGAATIPLVLLTSGWGRTDLAELVNGPAAFPAPFGLLSSPLLDLFLPNLPGQSPFHFLLFALDEANNATCVEYCWLASPFPTQVISNLETWISPYTYSLSATDISAETLSLDIGGMGMPASVRIQSRNDNGAAMVVQGASTKWGTGIADPVSRE